MVLTSQIIVGALVAGCFFFMLIVLLIGRGDFGSWELALNKPLTLVGIVAAFAILSARIVVPGVITAQMLRQLAEREQQPEWRDLFGVYQTMLIIKAAMIEGSIFLLLVMHMTEHSRWTLALAVVLLVILLAHMPTVRRVDEWIERQTRAIQEQRSMP